MAGVLKQAILTQNSSKAKPLVLASQATLREILSSSCDTDT